jgi:hypothetical protein
MRRSLVVCALALAAFSAQAREPQMASEGAVQYFCGGVGADERRAMQALEPQANLKLLFVTVKRGGYLADAAVTISDGKATRFSAVADGPVCLLQLPAGKYRVTADIGGTRRSVQVAVGAQAGKPRQAAFSFPGEAWDGIWASDEEKQQARE